jgi:hypothetical protein
MSENNYTWKPRWYYILRNKTSGKKYIGQTVRENMDNYCGSGGYWKLHCKKHGGLSRLNIEVVWREWFFCKDTAINFLKNFESKNPNYYSLECEEWANQVAESINDCPFASFKGQTRQTCASVAKMAEKMKGRKKETHIGPAKISAALTGRTKETHKSIKTGLEKRIGRTKENHFGLAIGSKKMSQTRLGRTKDKYEYVAKQGEKISNKLWINNNIVSKRIDKDLPLPEGFVLGRIKKAKA